ncbi:hypothetical protein Tco_1301507 [Tanacetum coccineum]
MDSRMEQSRSNANQSLRRSNQHFIAMTESYSRCLSSNHVSLNQTSEACLCAFKYLYEKISPVATVVYSKRCKGCVQNVQGRSEIIAWVMHRGGKIGSFGGAGVEKTMLIIELINNVAKAHGGFSV